LKVVKQRANELTVRSWLRSFPTRCTHIAPHAHTLRLRW